jgi:hypothetical protein
MATRQLVNRRIHQFFDARNIRVDAGRDIPGTPVAPALYSDLRAFPIENGPPDSPSQTSLPLSIRHTGTDHYGVNNDTFVQAESIMSLTFRSLHVSPSEDLGIAPDQHSPK